MAGDLPAESHQQESDNGENENDSEYTTDTAEPGEEHVLPDRTRKPIPELPDTVTVLEEDVLEPTEGQIFPPGKVYLVGTAHFSEESQNDVAKTISEVLPDAVYLELCDSRVAILSMDEEQILEDSQNLTYDKMIKTIKEVRAAGLTYFSHLLHNSSGLVKGVLHILLLSMSAHITRQLGMAPGGEFRTAFREAQRLDGCKIMLGDRPIQITLQRALSSLTIWSKLRLAISLLSARSLKITKEEVERVKQRDMLEELLAEMAGEFPALSRIFVDERDAYMAFGLRKAIRHSRYHLRQLHGDQETLNNPPVVVGVVGMGHVKGIQKHWSQPIDINDLMKLPKPSVAGTVLRIGVRGAFISLAAYGVYRIGRCVYFQIVT